MTKAVHVGARTGSEAVVMWTSLFAFGRRGEGEAERNVSRRRLATTMLHEPIGDVSVVKWRSRGSCPSRLAELTCVWYSFRVVCEGPGRALGCAEGVVRYDAGR